MKITTRKYKNSDFATLVKNMESFQDFLIDLDDLNRLRRTTNYGRKYTRNLLNKVKKERGLIIIAENSGEFAGFIAGIILNQSKLNLTENKPTRTGRILELFIAPKYRKKGTGKHLMKQIEKYFKYNKCDCITLNVFGPNKNAAKFYRNLGYLDRSIDLIKILKNKK